MERARRLADLDGSSRVVVEPPSKFFAAAQAEYPDAPVWSGELYLELHRGTLTSQVEIKQGNRRCENLLREAELWSTAALVAGRAPYPYDELEEIWRDVLLNQFHDILPGSSIAMVNDDAIASHAHSCGPARGHHRPGHRRVEAPPKASAVPVHERPCLRWRRQRQVPGPVAAGLQRRSSRAKWRAGVRRRRKLAAPSGPARLTGDSVLENDLLRVELNADGHIVSLARPLHRA